MVNQSRYKPKFRVFFYIQINIDHKYLGINLFNNNVFFKLY